MRLNPNRIQPTQSVAAHLSTPFKAEADAALSEFQATRTALERQVRNGEITLKVARQRAAEAAQRLRERLTRQAQESSAAPRVFLDRLVAVTEARRLARRTASLESLQREMIELLRQSIIEQQLATRSAEFEARAFRRPLHGGPPAPTLDSLLSFHETARVAGDEAAMEWARRQLEAFRLRSLGPEEERRIDQATDRPDRVNERTAARYVEALRGRPAEELERFVREAVDTSDSSACVAAFLLAREAPEGLSARWVREVLDHLSRFPDSALSALRAREAQAREEEAAAAAAAAEFAATVAEVEARFPSLHQPDGAEIRRRDEQLARTVDGPEEPIGLAYHRRPARATAPSESEPAA
ncbi:MAG: hypothetical protein KatS3mg108_2729 [Isosphaeraceae bacterium]|jgi:hypothetical protein|nr:MAG: hypothetical protein KatS3mg108_2729 [Isosphaeraceae bacterium]